MIGLIISDKIQHIIINNIHPNIHNKQNKNTITIVKITNGARIISNNMLNNFLIHI